VAFGPLLLSLLLAVLAVPIAQGSAAQRPIGWAWGYYYYSDAGASKLLAAGAQPGHYVAFSSGGAQAASSGISSTTVWIASLAVLGALLLGAWALVRRRRRQPEEVPACELTVAGC
jgi:hypothetical protein